MNVLDELVKTQRSDAAGRKSLSHYIRKIARLGGYLARSGDPPPGNIVMWRGLTRLSDLTFGFSVGAKLVGN